MRAESDGSSDKHTGNERERLTDSTRLPLMGSGLTWVMAEALKRGKREREKEEQRHRSKGPVFCSINSVTHTHINSLGAKLLFFIVSFHLSFDHFYALCF